MSIIVFLTIDSYGFLVKGQCSISVCLRGTAGDVNAILSKVK
jgi:hypothetical protein